MIVLDSSFLVAYHNAGDAHHAAARGVMEGLVRGDWGTGLLLEYVFLEVTTVLAARRGLATAVAAGNALLRAREVEFVPCSDVFLEAFDVFRRQRRGALSFTDAAIVAAARRRAATHVATFDRGFRGVAGLGLVPAV